MCARTCKVQHTQADNARTYTVETPTTGYYATWIAFIASVYYCYISIAALRGVTFTFGHALAIVLVSSIVEFAVAANICHGTTGTGCSGRYGVRVACPDNPDF